MYISKYVYPNMKLREYQITNYYFVNLLHVTILR